MHVLNYCEVVTFKANIKLIQEYALQVNTAENNEILIFKSEKLNFATLKSFCSLSAEMHMGTGIIR